MKKKPVLVFAMPFLFVLFLTSPASGFSLHAWDNFTGPASGFGWSGDWELPFVRDESWPEGDFEIIGDIEYTVNETAIFWYNGPLRVCPNPIPDWFDFFRSCEGQASVTYYVECRVRDIDFGNDFSMCYGWRSWFFRNVNVPFTWTVLTGSSSSGSTISLGFGDQLMMIECMYYELPWPPMGLEFDYIIITKDGPFEKWKGELFPWDPGYGLALSLVDPNGGEVLIAGDTYPITWSSTGSISDVLIEYSMDNGSIWTTIDTVTNTGSYDWLVPAVDSNQCLVRVNDVGNPSISDTSDGVFTITSPKDLHLLSPNGGGILNIIQNPGFETGVFSNWIHEGSGSVSPGHGQMTNNGWYTIEPHSGTYLVVWNTCAEDGSISQLFETIPSGGEVSFWWSAVYYAGANWKIFLKVRDANTLEWNDVRNVSPIGALTHGANVFIKPHIL